MSKPYQNQRIKNLLKMHFVKIKHIKVRTINQFFVYPEHSEKQSCEVLPTIYFTLNNYAEFEPILVQ